MSFLDKIFGGAKVVNKVINVEDLMKNDGPDSFAVVLKELKVLSTDHSSLTALIYDWGSDSNFIPARELNKSSTTEEFRSKFTKKLELWTKKAQSSISSSISANFTKEKLVITSAYKFRDGSSSTDFFVTTRIGESQWGSYTYSRRS